MKEKKHLSLLNNYRHQNKKLWIAIFAILACLFILTIKVITTTTAEKTIIVPAGFEKPFSVKGNEYSDAYKEQMAVYLMQLLFNYQPNNVKYQYDEFLRYIHPAEAELMKQKLNKEIANILDRQSSSVFYPNYVKVDGNTIIVRGELLGMVGTTIAKKSQQSYKITLDTENGFFVSAVKSIKLTNGNNIEETETITDFLN